VLASPRSSHRFIEMARTLVEDEATVDLAVVAAQIHLELHVKALITSAVADDVSPLRRVLVDDDGHTWRPHHATAKALLKALFGLDPARDYPRWQDYMDHLKRRNAVSHRGQAVSMADAEASIAVIDDLWLWLNAGAGGEHV
jgi:HEPN domain-containing protein